jgi:uncharacterized protein
MSGPILTSSRGAGIRPPLCWPLLPLPDEQGRLHYPDLETPYFGAGLEQAIHKPNNVGVRAELQRDIAAHIGAFEPRILLDRVDISPTDDPSVLHVVIAYRIRQIGVATAINVSIPVGGA